MTAANWTFIQKITFRFFFSWFILLFFPFPLNSIPFAEPLFALNETLNTGYQAVMGAYTELQHIVVPWVAKHLLGMAKPITIFTNGSGDTTYDYVLLLLNTVLALVAALVWTLIDRRRISYTKAHYWFSAGLRYYLALAMFGYGFAKVFHLQMPFPRLSQLIQLFGDKSPMGLAWSYIGYSSGYSAFTGWAEVIGGALLLFRRTTLLGAVVVASVMLNVMMINFFYDVPVKLYSTLLFLAAVVLVAPHAGRLLNLFLLNRPVSTATFPRYPDTRKWWIASRVYKTLFIVSLLVFNLMGSLEGVKSYGDQRPLPALYGIYNLETMIRNSDTLPPLTTDTLRWKTLVVQTADYAQVKMMDDSMRSFNFRVDTSRHQIVSFSAADTTKKANWSYVHDSTQLVMRGRMLGDSVELYFRPFDIKRFRLVSRGFNWINEYPLNR